jgi:hypothetical protein
VRSLLIILSASLALACGTLQPPRRTLPERIETVYLAMPRNDSYEYGFEEELARRLHEEFLADGRLRPVGPRLADARLDTTIRRINRSVLSFNEDDFPLLEETTVSVDLRLWEPERDDPTVEITGLSTSAVFNADPRRSQFDPEVEWREDLLQALAIRIVGEVLTHEVEEEIDALGLPAAVEVDLDRDPDQDIPSIRTSTISR